MTKIVINACHGGFGLSHEGVLAYAAMKGITLYPEGSGFFLKYWTVPEDQRPEPQDDFYAWSQEKRIASNKAYSEAQLYPSGIDRDDPALVAVVESMGEKASGKFAKLKVVEVPDDVEWEIEEYDGYEWVAEKHRTWS